MKQQARRLLNKNKKGLLPREVYVLSVVAFFVALGYGMIIPAIPLMVKNKLGVAEIKRFLDLIPTRS